MDVTKCSFSVRNAVYVYFLNMICETLPLTLSRMHSVLKITNTKSVTMPLQRLAEFNQESKIQTNVPKIWVVDSNCLSLTFNNFLNQTSIKLYG